MPATFAPSRLRFDLLLLPLSVLKTTTASIIHKRNLCFRAFCRFYFIAFWVVDFFVDNLLINFLDYIKGYNLGQPTTKPTIKTQPHATKTTAVVLQNTRKAR